MKLELKHLAIAITYNYSLQYFDDERELLHNNCKIVELRKEEMTIANGEYQYDVKFDDVKLLARPLSDITKYCEDLRFVPIIELLKIAVDEKDYNQGCFNSKNLHDFEILNGFGAEAFYGDCRFVFRYYEDSMTFSLFNHQGVDLHCGYKYIQKLYEWHFAVDIPSELYIDINIL